MSKKENHLPVILMIKKNQLNQLNQKKPKKSSSKDTSKKTLVKEEDLKRLQKKAKNLAQHHLIIPLKITSFTKTLIDEASMWQKR